MNSSGWKLPSLLRRVVALLREHPSLWLPVLIADLIYFVVMHLQHALHDPLLRLFFSRKTSVFSTGSRQMFLTPENAEKVGLLLLPLVWICYFLGVVLFTGALNAVSRMLDELRQGGRPVWKAIWLEVWMKKREVFLFSTLVFVGLAAAAVVNMALVWGEMAVPWLMQRMGFDLGALNTFVVGAPLALAIAPRALRLLADGCTFSAAAVRAARWAAVMGVAAQVVVTLGMEHGIQAAALRPSTIGGFVGLQLGESLVGDAPYVLLFVALALLAREGGFVRGEEAGAVVVDGPG